ncbi:unnamed protein product [Protopolystoma xenopodis]|uniref:Uncharacterized protein n=1 Tax=Protopolystoma xenopodis TaxID=117903 RepID=A0A448XEH7_9PLAT|nr:unnamed protein product [Protopolystoma xenopodis]
MGCNSVFTMAPLTDDAGEACGNIRASNGFSPLHIAVKRRHQEVTRLILGDGKPLLSDPNSFSKNLFTPLHLAAQHATKDIANMLISAGSYRQA